MSELEDRISAVLGDPAQMAEITKLAQSLMGGGSASPPAGSAESAAGQTADAMPDPDGLGIDAAMLARISRLMRTGGERDSDERALLEAMRPYLSEKRRSKMDRAIKLARLARLARLAIGELEDGDA